MSAAEHRPGLFGGGPTKEAASNYATSVWYMAAWSDELTGGELRHRKLLDQDLVLFRDEQGRAHALHDRCPHRFAPLHLGNCTAAGTIQCKYHGLEFDSEGRCVHNPHGTGTIPRNAQVRRYPLVERHGIVWAWFGDPDAADPDSIPDYGRADPATAWVARRYLHVKANYVLETDNILDLSHIQYLHPSTLGTAAVSQARTEVVLDGETVWCRREIRAEIPSPFLARNFGLVPGEPADRWLDVRWDAASSLLLLVSMSAAGEGRDRGRTIAIPHIFTPETRTTTHYWFASAFSRADGDDGQARAEAHVEGLLQPFATEDMPMLEAQQSRMGDADFWSLRPVLMATDAAAVRARRLLDARIQRDRESAERRA